MNNCGLLFLVLIYCLFFYFAYVLTKFAILAQLSVEHLIVEAKRLKQKKQQDTVYVSKVRTVSDDGQNVSRGAVRGGPITDHVNEFKAFTNHVKYDFSRITNHDISYNR
jgi:hypothetical protein